MSSEREESVSLASFDSENVSGSISYDGKLWTSDDIYYWRKGAFHNAYSRLGAHLSSYKQQSGVHFAVWAPNADRVSVVCERNNWTVGDNPLVLNELSGVWQGFFPGMKEGDLYKYAIKPKFSDVTLWKADPYAFATQMRQNDGSWDKASVVWEIGKYAWGDQTWMEERRKKDIRRSPVNIYECNLGSWARKNSTEYLTYAELAGKLVPYLRKMGYTHVEFMPLTEYPFDDSWGYQVTSYFAPTSRYGRPEDLMYLIDTLHQNDIGVILDWVPAHFPKDSFGLARFDGTCLYEHQDPRQGEHPDWNTYIFNFDRYEVRNFLISSARFWLECYHVDGLRVDAVASMLYLDYGKKDGGWIPNQYGGKENLGAIALLRDLNKAVAEECEGCFTCAEESTAWPRVTGSVDEGGLGFTFKWNMGWMHDTIEYCSKDPVYRRYMHNKMTFGMLYQYSEDFILPFSHDEVVYGKCSMLRKMPGDEWQRFAGLRTLYGYQIGYPGKKLLFMGSEFGQSNEWNARQSLDWHLLQYPLHEGMSEWSRELNWFYREHKELWELDNSVGGFRWLQCDDSDNSVFVFVRYSLKKKQAVMAVLNFTPVPRENYRIPAPMESDAPWNLVLNSDEKKYGGSGFTAFDTVKPERVPFGDSMLSLVFSIPPLSCMYYKVDIKEEDHSAEDAALKQLIELQHSHVEKPVVRTEVREGEEEAEEAPADDRVTFNHELK